MDLEGIEIADYEIRFQRIKRWVLLLLVLVFVHFWAGFFLYFAESKRNLSTSAKIDAVNLARAFEENVYRVIVAIDQTLLMAREKYQYDPQRFDIAELIKEATSLQDIVFQISIINQQGMLMSSNMHDNQSWVDLSSREHFQVHCNATQDVLFISKPLVGKVSGKLSIQFTRKLVDKEGKFAGVIVLSADPEYFSKYYSSIELGEHGIVALVGMDGYYRVRSKIDQTILDTKVNIDRVQHAMAESEKGTTIEYKSIIDGIDREYSVKQVRSYPVVVVVGLAKEDFLKDFSRQQFWALCFGAIFSVTLCYFGWILLQRYSTVVTNELSRLREQEERIRRLAQYDPLTGLANRHLLLDRLELAISKAKRHKRRLALLFIDLDKFKTVNDTLGHHVGDQLLKTIGTGIGGVMRATDTFARMGGDEFVVLLEDIENDEHVTAVGEKIKKQFCELISAAGLPVAVTMSIGISIYPRDGDSADDLMSKADAAMYAAKRGGGDAIAVC